MAPIHYGSRITLSAMLGHTPKHIRWLPLKIVDSFLFTTKPSGHRPRPLISSARRGFKPSKPETEPHDTVAIVGMVFGAVAALVLFALLILYRKKISFSRLQCLASKYQRLTEPQQAEAWSPMSSRMTPPPTYSNSQAANTLTIVSQPQLHMSTERDPTTKTITTWNSISSESRRSVAVGLDSSNVQYTLESPEVIQARKETLLTLEGSPDAPGKHVKRVPEAAFYEFIQRMRDNDYMRFSMIEVKQPKVAKLAVMKGATSPDLNYAGRALDEDLSFCPSPQTEGFEMQPLLSTRNKAAVGGSNHFNGSTQEGWRGPTHQEEGTGPSHPRLHTPAPTFVPHNFRSNQCRSELVPQSNMQDWQSKNSIKQAIVKPEYLRNKRLDCQTLHQCDQAQLRRVEYSGQGLSGHVR